MTPHVLVIGAVALGPKAAARYKRLAPNAKVTLIDQADRISYGGCGIPFYISGEVNTINELRETSYHVIRDAKFFKQYKDIDVLTQHQVLSINRAEKTVLVRNLLTNEDSSLPYDKLVLAMGAAPNQLAIPGIELQGVTAATTLEEAEYLKNALASSKVAHPVIIGAGFIGLEIAVAFADMWGVPTSMVEYAPQVLPNFLGTSLAHVVNQDLQGNNVTVYAQEKVLRLEGENGRVARVVTDKRTLPADLVVMAAGVHPNSQLAQEAGLEVTSRGLIVVDEYMRTSDPDIYAGGDVVSIKNLVSGQPGWFPLGSMANRQGRVIGTNLAGGNDTFAGAVGSWGVKLFTYCAAGAGLTVDTALQAGFDPISALISGNDRAHFYPERAFMMLELIVDRPTKKVLGIQGLCSNGDALMARINPVAALLAQGASVEDISNLEIVYSPPFASAMDIINTAGNVADNIIAGRYIPLSQEEFHAITADMTQPPMHFVDVREAQVAAKLTDKYPDVWLSVPQDEIYQRFDEIPKDSPVALICNIGLRSYEVQLVLAAKGFTNTKALAGGMSIATRYSTKL